LRRLSHQPNPPSITATPSKSRFRCSGGDQKLQQLGHVAVMSANLPAAAAPSWMKIVAGWNPENGSLNFNGSDDGQMTIVAIRSLTPGTAIMSEQMLLQLRGTVPRR
jgi:hypothetical protein